MRLSLTQVDQRSIFAWDVERVSRTQHLTNVFSSRWDFIHRRKPMIYIPVSQERLQSDYFCFGRIGKRTTEIVNAGPDALFEERTQEAWRAMNVALDTRNYEDGQKIAVDERNDVGKPLPVIQSLLEKANEGRYETGWMISAEFITRPQTFWDAVNLHKGSITRAEFRYITPNVLGLRSALSSRLREYKENENANEVMVILENKDGNLNLENDEVKDAVEYITEGAGSAKLKTGKEVVYSSKNPAQVVDVDVEEEAQIEQASVRRSLISRIFG